MTRRYFLPKDPEDALSDLPDGDLRYYLATHRVKATPARLALMRHLEAEAHLMPGPVLVDKLTKEKVCDETTAYRSLETLTKRGLIHRVLVSSDPSRSYYEIVVGRKHHHHIVCTSCGQMEDVKNCVAQDLNNMARSSGLKKFRQIQSHSLEFFGLCLACAKQSN